MYYILNPTQSLAQSLNEALSEDVDTKHLQAPTEGLFVTHVDAPKESQNLMQSSELSEGSSGFKDDLLSHTDSLLSKSLPSSLSSSVPDAVAERSVTGNWMSTWWIKEKPKREHPSLSVLTDELASGGLSEHRTHSSSSLTSDITASRTDKHPRHKPGRSAFGSLGFSIMKPTFSKNTKPQKEITVTEDTTAPAIGEEANADDIIQPAISSPIQGISATLPVPPQLTTSIDFLDEEVNSTVEKEQLPTQGSSLQAIVNATRVMTKDSSSILADQGHETGELIAKLAMELVTNARNEGLVFRGKPREKKQQKLESNDVSNDTAPRGLINLPGHSDAKLTLNKALTAQISNKEKGRKVTPASPYFFSPFFAEQQRKLSNAVGVVQKSAGIIPSGKPSTSSQRLTGESQSDSQPVVQKPRSVPLDSIIPDSAKPPTHYLSKRYMSLTSKDFKPYMQISSTGARSLVNRSEEGNEPLTDRYGFLYDISQYDGLLLRRAEECGNSAPACLTGVKIADRREEDEWSDDVETRHATIDVIKGQCDCHGDASSSMSEISTEQGEESAHQTVAQTPAPASVGRSLQRRQSSISVKSRSGTTMTSALQIPEKSLISILAVNPSSPKHVCEKVIRHMLDHLTEIHDQQQDARQRAWDSFLKQRSKARSKSLPPASASAVTSGGAAAILGINSAVNEEELDHNDGLIGFNQMGYTLNRDEQRELERLIRQGVPLIYRSKIWMECSGALEMMEPGVFKELLGDAKQEDSVLAEIAKDVGRTMPLNIFFGGDGPGIEKLRRVLTAYSRWVVYRIRFRPSIDYLLDVIQPSATVRA